MTQVTFRIDQVFPAGIARLWETLGRREYVERKYRDLGSTALRILSFDANAKTVHVTLERQVQAPPASVPAWIRPFSARHGHTLHHDTRWTRAGADRIDAVLDIRPVGRPIRARGDGTVVEVSPGRTQMKLMFTVQCDVPMLGGKAARFFADQLQRALADDHRFTANYLTAMAGGPRPLEERDRIT